MALPAKLARYDRMIDLIVDLLMRDEGSNVPHARDGAEQAELEIEQGNALPGMAIRSKSAVTDWRRSS